MSAAWINGRREMVADSRDPFARQPVPRAVEPAAEVARVRRENATRWMELHAVTCDVDELLARAAEAGTDVATAEARAGKLPSQIPEKSSRSPKLKGVGR